MRAQRAMRRPERGHAPPRRARPDRPAARGRRRARRRRAGPGRAGPPAACPRRAQSSTRPDSSASRISGRSNGGQAAMQRRGPEPDRHARRLPAGAAGALVGGGAADAQRGQPGQPGGGVQPRRAPPAAIHHDRARRARSATSRRCWSPAPRGGPRRAAARGPARRAAGRRAAAAPARRSRPAPPAPGGSRPCRAGRPGCRPACAASASRTARGHRVRQVARVGDVPRWRARPRTGNMRPALSITGASISADSRAPSSGRRHRQQPQLRPQLALQVQAQRQRQVGLQRALVHLVQDHAADAVQRRGRRQPAHQQALRHHLDPGGGGHGASPAGCGSRRCRRPPRPAAAPCGSPRRGRQAGAVPA